ncbi:MAG: hypothetical protein HY782_13805 [Chloroflexi bacterium]|nr:hypothetical protein [Chloroflexota bacterium]
MQITRWYLTVGVLVGLGLACSLTPPLIAPALDVVKSQSEVNDFGDAPDPAFPTLRASNGARTVDPTRFWLGTLESRPTTEADANLVDRDEMDDGLVEALVNAGMVSVTFRAVKSREAADGLIYFNLLADSNGDGRWQDLGQVQEWVVKNQSINLAPGESTLIKVEFALAQGTLEAWLRGMLAERPVNDSNWTGTGSFAQGEVEDHRIGGGRGNDWNVECDPNPLVLNHGQAGNINLRVAGGPGAPSQFRVVSAVGSAGLLGDPNAQEIAVGPIGPPAGAPGFTVYGAGPHINVTSKNIDEPVRTVEYTIDVRLEGLGRVETESCIVRVIYTAVKVATPSALPTTIKPTPRLSLTATPKPMLTRTATPQTKTPSLSASSPDGL